MCLIFVYLQEKLNFSSAEDFNDKKGEKKFRGGFKIESITQVRDPTRSLGRTKNTKRVWRYVFGDYLSQRKDC